MKLTVCALALAMLAAPVQGHVPDRSDLDTLRGATQDPSVDPPLDPENPPSIDPEQPPAPEDLLEDPEEAPDNSTASEPASTSSPPSGDPQPEPSTQEARREAKETSREVREEADMEAMMALLWESIAPVQSTAAEVEEELQDTIAPEDADEEGAGEAPAPASRTSGNVADGWREWGSPLVILGATSTAGAAILFWLAGSSGTAGAAGAAAQQAASSDRLRRLLPIASPLFTRFERDTILGHPKREQIYALIIEKPGITLQDMCAETDLSRTAVSHHLRLMEQQHLIVSKRVGRSRHFFENGGRYGRDQKDAYAVLHNDRSKEVHAFIENHPGSIQKDLCEALDIQASVAHWHVKRLVEANLVESMREGRTVSYYPAQTLTPVAIPA